MRIWKMMFACVMLWVMLCGLALAEQMAEDITLDCLLNGYSNPGKMRDGNYKTYYESVLRNGKHSVVITAPEGKTVGGILIKWRSWPVAVEIQAQDEKGEWQTVNACEADFVAQYLSVPELAEFRIMSANGGKTRLEISEITIVTAGTLPRDFQVWRKAPEKVDMMLVEAHPDDEVLWFAGLLPTYAGEQKKDVLVVNGSFNNYVRRLELCDSLWTCGVDIYPELLNYLDINSHNRNTVMKEWGEKTVMSDLVRLYRQYQPDVVVLHDKDGEYGHGAHKVLSELGCKAVEAAANAKEYQDSAKKWGVWDVPKVYVHLWPENQVQYDWHVPLASFDGLTGFQVAELAFDCHKTQQGDIWEVRLGGEYDNSLFGLYRSLVGPDVEKKDMFENLASRTAQPEAEQPSVEIPQPQGTMPTVTPEPGVTVTPQPNVTVTPEPNVTVTPQPGVTVTPQPNVTVTPQPGVTVTPPVPQA